MNGFRLMIRIKLINNIFKISQSEFNIPNRIVFRKVKIKLFKIINILNILIMNKVQQKQSNK